MSEILPIAEDRTRRRLAVLPLIVVLLAMASLGAPAAWGQSGGTPPKQGVQISYQLPADGPLPRTYRVTLAVTAPQDTNWIVSTFLAGAPRTVTRENQGRFTETWDGLDDNFMPVMAGTYGVKGIFVPAQQWPLDHGYHSFIPKYVAGVGNSWMPRPGQDEMHPGLWLGALGSIIDVAIGPDGKAAFYHDYWEGPGNPLIVDLTKPVGHGQIVQEMPSGGVAGGVAIATDGTVIWAVSGVGDAPNFIYRADRKPFGHGKAGGLTDVYLPPGRIVALAAWDDATTHRRFLYAAQADKVAGVLVLDGDNGEDLGVVPLAGIRDIAVAGDALFALHRDSDGRWVISRTRLGAGVPTANWQVAMTLTGIVDPAGFKIDRQGFAYVSDAATNQLYKLDPSGKGVLKFGRAEEQTPGHYDPQTFMAPGKLALWTDPHGTERLIVIERSGPGRISEWTTDGKLLRQWFPGQTQIQYGGFAVDRDDPEHIYMAASEASGTGLIRFRVDYGTGEWNVDAVWPTIMNHDRFPGGQTFPKIINHAGHKYLVFARNIGPLGYGCMIYRLDGDRWVPSAGVIPDPGQGKTGPQQTAGFWWHDANGDGMLDADEYRSTPAKLPTHFNYWGDTWLDDLSLVIMQEGSTKIWRIAPRGFDAFGNPIYNGDDWRILLSDRFLESHAAGTADMLHGGNEISTAFDNWSAVDGDVDSALYVNAYTGPSWADGVDSTGRHGSQVKISRYERSGQSGLVPRWRVGRKAFGLAERGEMYGTLHITGPINHILSVQDGNGLIHLFTDEGLYLDTLLVDYFRTGDQAVGGVYNMTGEMFNGFTFLDRNSEKVYLGVGRNSANIYEIEGWTGTGTTVSPVETLPQAVTITAGQIAAAPPSALRARGGADKAKILRILPATGGGPGLDGSMQGWDTAEPVEFGLDADHRVDLRTLYDPETLYLRWHVRLPQKFEVRRAAMLDRLVTSAEGIDTLSFYLQTDTAAPRASDPVGRPGDVRLVFAIVRDGGDSARPVVAAMRPHRSKDGKTQPIAFTSHVGGQVLEDVQLLSRARLAYSVDSDGKGFTLAAAIARTDLSPLPALGNGLLTTADAEATFAGRTKVWWANADGAGGTTTSDEPAAAELYPGSWVQAQFVPLDDNLPIGVWLVSGPWGGAGLRGLKASDTPDRPGVVRQFESTTYPPDDDRPDWALSYDGPLSLDTKGDTHIIRWIEARARMDDQMLHLDISGRLYFAATWIYVPEDEDIDCSFLSWPQNMTSAWIDGTPLRSRSIADGPVVFRVPERQQAVHFHRGWNRVYVRSYAAGTDLRIGMILHGPPDRLWRIRLSPTPP